MAVKMCLKDVLSIEIVLLVLHTFFACFVHGEDKIRINKSIMRSPKPAWYFSTDYIRCFCNLPSCVTTGYMCKSSGGGCFSELSDQPAHLSSVYRGRHGCLELLPNTEKEKCHPNRINGRRAGIELKNLERSLLICCKSDMCNHMESPQTKNIINHTILGDVTNNNEVKFQHQKQEPFLYSNSEVWFRAATIAVPICGAIILLLLIVLAVRILKSEHQNSAMHKLGPTMYFQATPQQSKYNLEKYQNNHSNSNRTYENLRKDYVVTHHQNVYFCNQPEEFQRAIEMPVLVHKKTNSSSNSIQAQRVLDPSEIVNLINSDSKEDNTSKSIILEIDKNIVDLEKNINSDEKYSKETDLSKLKCVDMINIT